MKLEKIEALTPEYLESIGFTWHTDSDDSSYICDKLVVISEDEAKIIMLTNNEYDPELPIDDEFNYPEFSLYDTVVGDDFVVVGSTEWD